MLRTKLQLRWVTRNLIFGKAGIPAAATLLAASLFAAAAAGNPSQAQTTASPEASAPSTQTTPASPQPANAVPAKAPASQTHSATANRAHHKKKVLPAGCDSVPAAAGPGASSSAPAAGAASAGNAATRPTNCPPPKVVVRQGGTSEPSIQVAGGTPGDQTSHQRDTDQLLATTETNLKKIEDRHLTPAQQDMVNQIHQFMDQSKTNAQSGELDRARTLAWKAEVLSEELVKPEK